MNWEILIYAGMAAAGAGLMTAGILYVELEIPAAAAVLSGRAKQREVEKIREQGRNAERNCVPVSFRIERRVLISFAEETAEETPAVPDAEHRTKPLEGRWKNCEN